uniref:Protein BTN n=1 Tax=Psilocybe cubensis TaxID=181762 RepID=A0A8H7XS69_PSICU
MPPNHPPFGSGSLATIITREEPESDEEDRGEENQDKGRERTLLRKLGFSFFLFGLINNVLYVIILSAALDLVPPATPKGIIAFCNIAPSLFAKISWPYLLKGRIRYTKRLLGCCLLSTLGMLVSPVTHGAHIVPNDVTYQVVALFDSLYMRLLGIGLASFSSGSKLYQKEEGGEVVTSSTIGGFDGLSVGNTRQPKPPGGGNSS